MNATKMYQMEDSAVCVSGRTPLEMLRHRFPAYTPAGNLAWDYDHDCGIICGEVVAPYHAAPEVIAAARALAPEYEHNGRMCRAYGAAGTDYLSGTELERAMIAAGLGTEADIDPANIAARRN